MMNLMLLRTATLLFTSGALIGCAETPDSAVSGVYSNVRYSDETGDAAGFEVQLDANASQPIVVFTICKGWLLWR